MEIVMTNGKVAVITGGAHGIGCLNGWRSVKISQKDESTLVMILNVILSGNREKETSWYFWQIQAHQILETIFKIFRKSWNVIVSGTIVEQ